MRFTAQAMHNLARREEKAHKIHAVIFMGFGGTSMNEETMVFSVQPRDGGWCQEIRIPRRPSKFPPDAVAQEYRCLSGRTLRQALDDLLEKE